MTIWFLSDEHYFHRNIILYASRPFSNVQEMNQGLIERHNSVVKDSDEVWHLGDFSFKENEIPNILKQLKGLRHYIVCGNHDSCFAGHKKHEAAKQRYLLYGFAGVHQNVMNFEGQFNLSHLPYLGGGDNSEKERYSAFRLKDEGKILLHGHLHSKPENRIRGKMFDVGVDSNNYFPISIDEIIHIMRDQ